MKESRGKEANVKSERKKAFEKVEGVSEAEELKGCCWECM